MNTHRKQKKQMTATIMATLLAMPACGYAFVNPPEYVYYNGKPMVEMQFLTKGEGIEKLVDKAGYTLSPSLIQSVKSSTAYWTGMVGPKAKNVQPWQVFVTTQKNEQNAYASTTSVIVKNRKAKGTEVNFVAQQLQDGKKLLRMTDKIAEMDNPPSGDYGLSEISIGQYMGAARKGAVDGWWVDTDTVLPTNEQAADFVGTFRHELGHALGISKAVKVNGRSEETGEVIFSFSPEVTDKKSWNLHLVDQNLNQAKPGMEILSAGGFAEKKKANPDVKKSDFFIVNNRFKKEDASGKNGKAFFIGTNVTDALAGATFFGVNGVPVNGWEHNKFEGSHLQTTGMMSHRDYSNYTSFMEVELAVMQDLGYDIDREAYFGHSVYGDGKTFTNTQGYSARNEAGTAYIKGRPSTVPLGIGLHIYGSRNTVTQAADILTNGTGATGIRVDGMQNTVIVPAATSIHADGLRGNGFLIAYGRDQVVNQAGTVTANGKGGTGIRFDFGSSSNGADDEYRGSYIRYKRSVKEGTGAIDDPDNLKLTDMDENVYNAGKDELNGPQVKEYNLSGSLSGAENAIYISKNAFVKNINIKNGASIRGNIISDWKHFNTDGSYDGVEKTEKEPGISFEAWMAKNHPGENPKPRDEELENNPALIDKYLQYAEDYEADSEVKASIKTVTTQKGPLLIQFNGKTGDKGYAYDAYIPDLVTNLNFAANMTYDGNITGPDNMKLNVKSGTLVYGGKADVVGVHVAEGATLLGGSYTVHDMSSRVASDFASRLDESDKGFFINCGTAGALTSDSSMTINGNLLSDGTLLGVAGGSAGTIQVSGLAMLDNAQIVAKNLLPNEKFAVVQADGVYGSVKNTQNAPYKFGMLDEIGAIEGNTAVVTGEEANNLGAVDAVQGETYEAMMEMFDNLTAKGDARRNEMRPLFTLTPEETKKTLSSIGSNASAKSMALAQRSTVIQHLLSSRLKDAFTAKETKANIPVQHLDDSSDEGVPVTLRTLEPADNDIWLKFGKNWGDMRNDTDYHSTATLLGWDKAYGKNWRAGVFAGYSKTSFSDNTASNELRDVRFGLYGGYSKGRSEGLVYLDYGWLRNKLRRGITNLGLTAGADYHSRILELGGEYLYDLQAEKNVPWHVRPYVNAQLSRLWQNSYREDGAGVFGQVVDSKQNNYFGMGAGVEFKRYLAGGSYAIRAGVKHAFAGAEPKLRYSYMGDAANTYDMRNVQDKTHFVLSIGGEAEVAKGWTVGGDATFQRGSHDKDWSCSITVKRMW